MGGHRGDRRAWARGATLTAVVTATVAIAVLAARPATAATVQTAAPTTSTDDSAALRAWLDLLLKALGFGATSAGIFFAAFQYRAQRQKDRLAAEDRDVERRRRELFEGPRCNVSVTAHLLQTADTTHPATVLNAEVELESRSEARIDFVYGTSTDPTDGHDPETSITVYGYDRASIGAALGDDQVIHPSPDHLIARVPLHLGDIVDPAERVTGSALLALPEPADDVVYLVCARITVGQATLIALQDSTALDAAEAASVQQPFWILSDQAVLPAPGTVVASTATDGPSG